MEVGDWVLADVDRNWYLSYIDSFSADEETLHITRIAKSTQGKLVWVDPVPATCHKSLVGVIGITIPPEDYMEMYQLMIDLSLQTGTSSGSVNLQGR